MSRDEWKPKQGGTVAPHWIDLEIWPEGCSGPEWRANVKWDGCIHLSRYFNGVNPDTDKDAAENSDYMHICDLDGTIAMLQALKAKALEHFGADWPR